MANTITDDIGRTLDGTGLILRGCFYPEAADGVSDLPDGRSARTVAIIGNAGGALWERFAVACPEPAGRNPLEDWLAPILRGIAARVGGHAVLPKDGPPYPPMQHWAKRAESVHSSPIGILIHPEYGLWHAYRGAILFPGRHAFAPRRDRPSPCESCAERPCLSTCPVGAFSADGYDVGACVARLGDRMGVDCRNGCLARRACPIGRDYLYPLAANRLHMAAMARANRT
jgi:hypothetical protein